MPKTTDYLFTNGFSRFDFQHLEARGDLAATSATSCQTLSAGHRGCVLDHPGKGHIPGCPTENIMISWMLIAWKGQRLTWKSLSWGKAGWVSLSWERALSKAPLRLSIAEIQKIFPVFTFRPVILISRYINISQCFNLRAYVVSPGKDLQESSGGPLNMLHLLARMKTQVPY